MSKIILNLKMSKKDGILFPKGCVFNLRPQRKNKESIIEVEKFGGVVGYLYRYYDDKGDVISEKFEENYYVKVIWE